MKSSPRDGEIVTETFPAREQGRRFCGGCGTWTCTLDSLADPDDLSLQDTLEGTEIAAWFFGADAPIPSPGVRTPTEQLAGAAGVVVFASVAAFAMVLCGKNSHRRTRPDVWMIDAILIGNTVAMLVIGLAYTSYCAC